MLAFGENRDRKQHYACQAPSTAYLFAHLHLGGRFGSKYSAAKIRTCQAHHTNIVGARKNSGAGAGPVVVAVASLGDQQKAITCGQAAASF